MADTRIDKYTVTGKKSETFSDFLVDLDPHPDAGDLVRYVNEDAVKSAIRNLVLTNKYDCVFDPARGSNVKASLFENMTDQTASRLQEDITRVITNYEPRARLISVTVTAYPDQNAYVATIIFYTINSSEPISLPLILRRAR